ncbi:MAG: BMP family ABC transporter substrate-binding protein [Clostridiaceae bacterium]|nr:BMP family ABC transporter substrate-binding protein [Clostridiaceae bacterium]
MDRAEADSHYLTARKLGVREYSKSISKGMTGYLPFLEGVLKNIEIVYELDLGIVDIPMKKIVGTYTYGRSRSFAVNFMPLLKQRTEFASKWSNLCQAHINEGIRDPIKVYEYLNWFYVVEGNKRVSVLKYFDAYSIQGRVSRLVPKRDENDTDISIYYEFMEFYKKTNINLIWFTKRNSFNRLMGYLDNFEPTPDFTDFNKYKYFANSIYMPFRRIYLELGGQELPITTGDAFLEYITVYGMPYQIEEQKVKSRLRSFLIELDQMSSNKSADIQTVPTADSGESLISTLTTFVMPRKTLKVSFVYAKDTKTSSWTYAQEMGRIHVSKVFGDAVSTSFVDNVPETSEAYGTLKQLAKDGNDVVFVTSPAFINATLKAALEFPGTKYLNCSETHSFKHVNTYFGRIYEPRFLAGIASGAVTRTNTLGYVASRPIPDVVNGINSFALGARLVNPNAVVKVEFINSWDDTQQAGATSEALILQGADVIAHHDTLSNRKVTDEYGVYAVMEGPEGRTNEHIAAPVWNWGIFYEKMLYNLMKGSRRSLGADQKVINFWWGMDSGIVDFFYSRRLVPPETQKLLDFMKKMIINGLYHPFTGPIYSRDGALRVKKDEIATREQIIGMDWYVNIVDGELPVIDISQV